MSWDVLSADSDLTSLGGPAPPNTKPAALRRFLPWTAGNQVSERNEREMMLRRGWAICADGRGHSQFCSSSETKKTSFEDSVSLRTSWLTWGCLPNLSVPGLLHLQI